MKKFKLITVSLIIMLGTIFVVGCSSKSKIESAMDEYNKSWQNQDFEKMYTMLSEKSQKNISKEDFVQTYTDIYTRIKAKNIKISKSDQALEEGKDAYLNVSMDTLGGKIDSSKIKIDMVKEGKGYKVNWDYGLILPDLKKEDKVGIDTDSYKGKRGSIYDRNGNLIAGEGQLKQVQLDLKKFKDGSESNKITDMANILDISPSYIENKINSNTNPDHAVDIVSLLESDNEKIEKLLQIPGVQITTTKNARVYNGGEAIGSLIGYTGNITQEQLKDKKNKGYNENSKIGIGGIEEVYEDKLRAEDGGCVYILTPDGQKKVLVEKKAKNGEDVKLSIDLDLQKKVYDEMKDEKGASVATNPKTGEVLAMVSSPSFDPNSYMTYITKSEKAKWEADNNAQLQRRFKTVYSPGSTMKLVTATIGLEDKKIDPDEAVDIKGKTWEEYDVTRVTDPGKPVNLKDATVYSDNIYFAKAALNIGGKDFVNGAKKFGIGEDIKFGYPIEKSQISNSGNLDNKSLLAATGYGQGEVLTTPLNMTMIYSSLGNDGKIMMPKLDITKSSEPKVYKQAINTEYVDRLKDCFSAVINDPKGTGHSAKIEGINIAGKTGTAELKKDKDDTNANENGWFAGVDTDEGKLSISMIIENVKGRGGSEIPTVKVKNIMEYYLKK
ncbi:penicillin-binding transpeptidase domain-containing protein [Paraclostridium bifermentans]|uniref:penicillin-binding transpeptidase domain-containing protein n=1 Tax=Paraclostridium bifermentans TaxID=1490 RepID=UPI001FF27306|nr:penicillin-binding transpeptidase domain-containing protein [Paraclostridium bifermentans]UOW68927.1 penicillin-binding transpeptidase domain-containing protein [Paraclostridium bifermentans]